ncbi:MAG: amidohydrolase [Acidimicrobiia bacterium]|nr:amidohydrolase [Acidimicrobiia bacterium]
MPPVSDGSPIDIHTHILPAAIPDFRSRFGYGEFITLEIDGERATMLKGGSFFREVDRRLFDPQARLASCDESGIGTQVLSTVPVMFSYWTEPRHGAEVAAFLNDDLAATVAANPDRFVALGTLPMQDTDLAVSELERCMSQLDIAGVEIGTNVEQANLNEARLFPIFEAAADLGAAVFVHPWDMMGQEVMPDYWLPWLVGMPAETSRAICSMMFGGVFERLPRLRVAFAHGGGSFPATFDRIQHGFDALPDYVGVDNHTPPSEYLGRFWLDSMVHSPSSLRSIADLVGTDKVCLGSDYPFRLGEAAPGTTIRAAGFGGETEAALLTTNARAWLGEPSDV